MWLIRWLKGAVLGVYYGGEKGTVLSSYYGG